MLIMGIKKQNKKEQELFIQDEYFYYPMEFSADFIGTVPNGLSYQEYMAEQKKKKLDHLKAIETLMLEEDYKEKRTAMQQKLDSYTLKKNDMMQKVRDYEAEESERLGNEMASIEEFNALYKHIDEMFTDIAASKDYQDNEAMLASLKEDSVLYDSLNYYLSEEDRGEVINDDFHYGMIESFDYVIVDDQSYIISEAIEECEKEKISDHEQFNEFYKHLKKPIKKFGPVIIGQTEDNHISIIKEISYKELTIDDLCHLQNNEGVMIR